MREFSYPKSQFPEGHADLALCLNNLGTLLDQLGNHAQARQYLERAIAMNQALYPRDKNPLGHPQLAVSLSNLAVVLQNQGAARQRGDMRSRRWQ